MQPVTADYTEDFQLPPTVKAVRRTVIYFPGSTIGNLDSPNAVLLLRGTHTLLEPNGGVLIGLDLKKDRNTLERAYNDEAGVTAEFNLNLLRRINRELDGDFDLSRFRHRAIYNSEEGRIEMYLVSEEKQTARVAGRTINFEKDEPICTEFSHKYSSRQFDEIAKESGFEVQRTWVDEEKKFAVKYLVLA